MSYVVAKAGHFLKKNTQKNNGWKKRAPIRGESLGLRFVTLFGFGCRLPAFGSRLVCIHFHLTSISIDKTTTPISETFPPIASVASKIFDHPIPHFLLPVCFRLWAVLLLLVWSAPHFGSAGHPIFASMGEVGIPTSVDIHQAGLGLIARRLRDGDVVCVPPLVFNNATRSKKCSRRVSAFGFQFLAFGFRRPNPLAPGDSPAHVSQKMHYVVDVVGWNVDVRFWS